MPQLLRKRYAGAHQPGRELTPDEISHVVRLRLEVFDTLSEWILQGGGAQDALDDGGLYEAFLSFLTQPTEQKLLEVGSNPESDAGQSLRQLDQSRKSLLATFRSQTMRPSPRSLPAPDAANDGMASASYSSELPDIDQLDPEELVNNLNLMASATFRNVTQEVRAQTFSHLSRQQLTDPFSLSGSLRDRGPFRTPISRPHRVVPEPRPKFNCGRSRDPVHELLHAGSGPVPAHF